MAYGIIFSNRRKVSEFFQGKNLQINMQLYYVQDFSSVLNSGSIKIYSLKLSSVGSVMHLHDIEDMLTSNCSYF